MTEASQFLLTCKAGVLQFFLIKPLTSLLAIIFHSVSTDLYDPEIMSPVLVIQTSSYVYLSVIINVSMTFSLWYLVKFYYALRESLRKHNPVAKFVSVKSILFFSYWQGVTIAVLRWCGVLDGFKLPQERLSTNIQNTLICAEMLIFSVIMQKAFSYQEYKFELLTPFPMTQLHTVLKEGFKDAVKDISQISPIVIPTGFRPRFVSSGKIECTELDSSESTASKL